jgi:hypothetical protein
MRLTRFAVVGLLGLMLPPPAGAGDEDDPVPGNLAYTAVTPCRIADTRQAGGSLAVGLPRDFRVTGVGLQGQGGSAAGCAVPQGPVRAVVVNFVAVNPTGAGNLRGWAYSTPPVGPPAASILNYAAVPGLNIANAIVIPICQGTPADCPFDLRVQASASGSHLVMDVVGYFSQASLLAETPSPGGAVALTPICTAVQQLTVNVPSAGRVVVRASTQVYMAHVQGAADDVYVNLAATPADCTPPGGAHGYRRWIHPNAPATESVETGGFWRVFPVAAAGSQTFYLNAFATGGGAAEFVSGTRLLATFHPN